MYRIMKKILENTGLVLASGLFLGLLAPFFAQELEPLLVPALILALSLSLREIEIDPGLLKQWPDGLKAYLLNLGLGFFIVLLAYLLIDDPGFFRGCIVMAFVPPAIAVVAFSYLLGGDRRLSVVGEVSSYLLCLISTPLLVWFFTGGVVSSVRILRSVGVLILAPIVLSRLVRRIPLDYQNFEKSLINLCFFVVGYVMIGVNQASITRDWPVLIPVVFLLVLRTFGVGLLLYRVLPNKMTGEKALTFSLFGSFKNAGMASVLAYQLFESQAAIPAALSGIFELGLIIYLERES